MSRIHILKSVLALSAASAALSVAHAQTAPEQAPEEAAPAEAAQEVTVTGFRASLASAIELKRAESGVVDAINAQDIAEFPDLNLAESLQRIPGVAISRRSGEGRQITVRGLGSDYTRVRVNGMEAISTSSGTANSGGTNRGRGFDFNIFSSDLFSNLTVRKTASAEVDEGSLGATVDLNAAKPLDFKKPQLVIGAQGSYNSLTKDVTPGVSMLASTTMMDGRLGLLLSVAYDERHLIEEGANITRWTYGGSNGGWNAASTVPGKTIAEINRNVTQGGDPTLALYHPRIPAYASYDTRSKRLGISAAMQFQASDSTMLTLEGLFSDFRGKREESQLQALGLSRPGTGKPQSIIRDGVVEGNNLVYAQIDRVDLRTQSSRNELNTRFYQITSAIDQDIGDRLKLRLSGGYSKSRYSDPVATTVTFERIDSNNFVYDFRPRMMQMNLNFDATDPAAWAMVPGSSEVRLTPELVDNDYGNIKLSGEYELNDALTLKAGVDWKKFGFFNQASQRANTANVPAIAAGSAIDALSRQFTFGDGLNLDASSLQTWLAPDLDKFISTHNIYSNTGIWQLFDNTGSHTSVGEKTIGVYGQLDFKFDALGSRWRGDIGGRWFRTQQNSGGFAAVGATVQYVTADNDYSRFLPSANLAIDLTDTLVARIAAAKTIARPGLGSLTPGGRVTVQGANRNFSTGNPYLKPTESNNLDIAFEWYPSSGTILSVGGFYKDINTFVQTLRTEAVYNTLGLPASLLDGTVATPDMVFAVTRPVNSSGGRLKGFEINWQQPLKFLPGFLSNLGLLANYTYVTSDISYLTSTVPTDPKVRAPLIGLSKHAWNATLYYETDRFSIRGSVAYRSGYLTAVPGNDFNSWHGTNATTNIDMQVSYNFTDKLKLSLEGINLTDEYADLYVDRTNRLNAYTHTGRQFVLSARMAF